MKESRGRDQAKPSGKGRWIGVVTGLMGEFPMWERIRVQCVGGLGGDRRDKGISRCGR